MAIKTFFKKRLTMMLAVLFPVYMFFLHAPFEMYLTNSGDFWFGLADFWQPVVITFAAVYAVLFLIGAILPEKLRNLYSVVAVAGGLCIYIQGNFLNLDLGTLNGAEIIWSDYKGQFLANGATWLAIAAIAIVLLAIFKKKALKVMAAVGGCVMLMQAVTLGTLFLNNVESESAAVEEGQYSVTDKDLYTVSQDQNVVVMLLDMFDNRYMRQILQETPEVKDTFKDFTFFDNAVGAYSTTCYAVGNFLTGTTVNNQGADFNASVDLAYENTQMFDELIANDYLLDIYISDGYIPQKLRQNIQNYEPVQTAVVDTQKLAKRLYRLVACRFAPNGFKPFIWMNGTEFAGLKTLRNSENQAYSDNNLNFYNGLTEKGLSLSEEKRFKFIHLLGTHYPYEMNSNLKPIPATSSDSQAVDTAKGVLKIAAAYIDEMKKNGAYDNATIVLIADHGFYLNGVLTNPLVMVKRPNTDQPFTISQAPVSHYDLHATIMSSLGLNEDGKYGRSMFDIQEGEERERVFYQYNLSEGSTDTKFRLIEWLVSGESNDRKNFRLSGYEYNAHGEKCDHTANCQYCAQHGTDPVDAPNEQSIVHEP